ncbi:MAG: ATP-binding protein [Sandaracinus sp.]
MRRALVALLVGLVAAAALVYQARSASDEARTSAQARAEDDADARAAIAGGAIDGWTRAHAGALAPDAAGLAALAHDLGVELAPASAPIEEHEGSILRRVRTIPAALAGTPTQLVLRTPVVLPAREPTRGTLALAVGLGLLLAILTLLAGGARRDRALEEAAARVGRGDLDVTIDGRGATASAFNRMTRELKDTQHRLARAERIAAWRDIARRIAHEIKNPLTPIKMAMETVRKTRARQHPDFDEIFDESTKTVLEETARLEKIVTEFSRFARMPRPKAESLDVREVAEKVVAMHDLPAAAATLPEAAKGVRVELVAPERLPSVRADREQLTQVLVNLVQNACDAAREKQGDEGGRVVVSLARTEDDGIRVVVADNGPGIPVEARDAVREPYYTTKSHGTGLGLAIVDRIVSDHGGTLTLGDALELGGAAVTVVLRREGPAEESEASLGV